MKELEEIKRCMQDVIIKNEYIDKSMENFIEKIEELKKGEEEKGTSRYNASCLSALELICLVMKTKKFNNNNHKELAKIGEFLQKLGKEMEEYKESKKEKENSEETFEEMIDKLFGDM